MNIEKEKLSKYLTNYLLYMEKELPTLKPPKDEDDFDLLSWLKMEIQEVSSLLEFLNSENTGSDSAVTQESGDYTNVSLCTDHGDTEKTAVESALASTPETENLQVSYHNNCEDCEEPFWTNDAFETICSNCK